MKCRKCVYFEGRVGGKGFCKAPGSLDEITEKLFPDGIPKTAETPMCGMAKTKKQLKKEKKRKQKEQEKQGTKEPAGKEGKEKVLKEAADGAAA